MNPKIVPTIVGFCLLLPALMMSAVIVLAALWIVSLVKVLDDRSNPHRLAWIALVVFLGPLGCLLYLAKGKGEARNSMLHSFSRPPLLG